MKLNELKIYNQAVEVGECIWEIVSKWNYFPRNTLGKQLVRSTDSIAANISEGFGRYHFKDNRNFLYYARGSLYETSTWLTKAYNRQLIKESEYNDLNAQFKDLGIKLNNYIKTIGTTKNKNYE
ncbi:MAG: four helix bundle protein [Bacteroidales bacterium]